jgi:cytosine/adenosine deaminase-related metal-dependent hydrolase
MGLLADRDVKVLHCPGANLKLGSGIARVPEMLERGISVSLGADGAACNNNLSIFQEMRMAALIQKPRLGPAAMPAREVFRMATIGGAEALGLDRETGSLEPGKRGDIVLLDPCRVHAIPMEDLYSQIVYSMNTGDVRTTIVDGRVLVDNTRLLVLDEEELVRNTAGEVEKLLRRASARRAQGKGSTR